MVRLKHTTKLGDANKWRFISKSIFNNLDVVFNNFIETIHICHMSHHRWKCVAVPNQVVGGRVSLLNKGNFCHPPRFSLPPKNWGIIGCSDTQHQVTLCQRLSVMESWPIQCTRILLSWNHDRPWIDPRQCNYWNQKGNNNKSECGAFALTAAFFICSKVNLCKQYTHMNTLTLLQVDTPYN